MQISAEFTDGNRKYFDVSGEGFSPDEGQHMLFVYPDGSQREGKIVELNSDGDPETNLLLDAMYNPESGLVHVTI